MTNLRSASFRLGTVLLAAAVFTIAGCAGGSSEGNSAPDAEEPAATVAATIITGAPTTEAEPVVTTSSTTATSTTTTTVVDVVASAEAHCDASREYWVPGGALAFYGIDDAEAFDRTFDDLDARIQAAIDTAPNDTARQPPTEAQVILAELTPLLAEVDFDPRRLETLGVGYPFEALLVEFETSQGRLATFLLEQCGFVRQDLIDLARDYASGQATQPLLDDADPLPDADPTAEPTTPSMESTLVSDASGRIEVEVPAEWSDVSGEPGPTEDRLIASTDRESFLAGFSVPGMFIEAVDIPDGSGRNASRVAVDRIITTYEGNGCVQLLEVPYSDPLYEGTELVLSCVQGFEVRLIAGTDATGERIFVIVMALEEGDVATRDLIAETFFV